MSVEQNYLTIRSEIDQICKDLNRNPKDVLLLAVSKTVGIEKIDEAYNAGCRDFGENRPDILVEKYKQRPDYTWHFIGNIQSRRIPDIVACSSLIHSVCSLKHLKKINKEAKSLEKVQKVLIEVNVSGEESKSGFQSSQVIDVLREAEKLEFVSVVGFMTMAPRGNSAIAQKTFKDLKNLAAETQETLQNENILVDLDVLSMGMSEDWHEALAENATIVRIGRAIFEENFDLL